MANREVTQGESTFIEELMEERGDKVKYYTWIRKVKRGKVDERVIIVSQYKVFTVKRTVTGGKQIRREGHLYDLKSVSSTGPEQLVLTFGNFFIDVQSPKADELLKALRESYRKITIDWAQEAQFRLNVPEDRSLPLEPEEEPVPPRGFLQAYPAWCVYFNHKPTIQVLQYVKDCVERKTTIFDLSVIPGTDPHAPGGVFSIQPVFSTLRHNRYFTGIHLSNICRSFAIRALADAFSFNSTVVDVSMRNVGVKDGYVELGNAISQNKYCRIQHIDFSGNRINDKGAQGLGMVLSSLSLGLISLRLNKCQITPKGFKHIFSGLEKSSLVAQTLTELSISYNRLKNDGTNDLSAWTTSCAIGGGTLLKILNVRHCKPNVSVLATGLKNSACPMVEDLDISGSKIDKNAVASICGLFANTQSLKRFAMSECNINKEGLCMVVKAMISSTNLSDTTLDISAMGFGNSGMKVLADPLSTSVNLHTLNIGLNQLKPESIIHLCEVMQNCSTLKCLYLDSAAKPNKSSKEAAGRVAQFVRDHSGLETLYLRGRDDWHWGPHTATIMNAVADTMSLKQLYITGCRGGDPALVALGEALKKNQTLRSISIDGNLSSLAGFQSILYALSVNTTLIALVTPRNDLNRLKTLYSSQPQINERLRETMNEIQSRLNENWIRFREASPEAAGEYVKDLDGTPMAALPESRHVPVAQDNSHTQQATYDYGSSSTAQPANANQWDGGVGVPSVPPMPAADGSGWDTGQGDDIPPPPAEGGQWNEAPADQWNGEPEAPPPPADEWNQQPPEGEWNDGQQPAMDPGAPQGNLWGVALPGFHENPSIEPPALNDDQIDNAIDALVGLEMAATPLPETGFDFNIPQADYQVSGGGGYQY